MRAVVVLHPFLWRRHAIKRWGRAKIPESLMQDSFGYDIEGVGAPVASTRPCWVPAVRLGSLEIDPLIEGVTRCPEDLKKSFCHPAENRGVLVTCRARVPSVDRQAPQAVHSRPLEFEMARACQARAATQRVGRDILERIPVDRGSGRDLLRWAAAQRNVPSDWVTALPLAVRRPLWASSCSRFWRQVCPRVPVRGTPRSPVAHSRRLL